MVQPNENKRPEKDTDKEKLRILFVCLGNICRSPAAEGVMKELLAENGLDGSVEVDSAGTGNWHVGQLPDNRMRVHARRRGLTLEHRCRQVRTDDFDDFDIIVGMDHNNVDDLKALAPTPEAAAKVVHMARYVDMAMRYDHIPDPYYEGAEGFELMLDLLQNGCANMVRRIQKNLPLI